jgi:hypothetical protein
MNAEQAQKSNPGSRVFTAGTLSIVVRRPLSQEWDLYVDMRRKKPAEARAFLRGYILYPGKDELARLCEAKPAIAKKLEELVWTVVAPETGTLVDSDKHPGAQALVCDGVTYHLRQPTEADYERFEDDAKGSYSRAALILLKACLLEPNVLDFDSANELRPGLKHVLAGHLARMAGEELEFTEKK